MVFPFPLIEPAAPYLTGAVRFNADRLDRDADLDGNADGKEAIGSFWFNLKGGDSVIKELYFMPGGDGIIRRDSDNTIRVAFTDGGGTGDLDISTTGTFTAAGAWRHVLFSFDMATAGARWLYVDDTSDISVAAFNDDTLDFTQADHHFGAKEDDTRQLDADVADFFLHFGSHLDLDVEANRRKFIDANGKPVDLGDDGSKPLGVQPLVFLRRVPGEAASTFATNKGSGGGLTVVTGALADADDSPTD